MAELDTHIEPLDGGLVNSVDASLIKPGELSLCQNAVYDPNSLSLARAPGRVVFGTVSAGVNVNGLTDLTFDNGNRYLVAELANGTRYRAPVGDTGSWTSSDTGLTSGNYLDSVHYQNSYYLFNGANPNRIGYLTAVATATTPSWRGHGMAAVSAQCTAVSATATSAWSFTSTGFYEYWTTEVFKYTKDGVGAELESTFVGDPATVSITSTSSSVVITRPNIVNDGTSGKNAATHWRVYRSPKKENRADKQFPTGFLIGTVAIDTETMTDGVAPTATTFSFVSSSTSTSSPAWSNPTNIQADDGSNATCTVGNFTSGSAIINSKITIATATDPIGGIEVVIECQRTSGIGTLNVYLNNGRDNLYLGKAVPITGSLTQYTLGGSEDLWGGGNVKVGPVSVSTPVLTDWLASDFTAGNVNVRITATGGISGGGNFAVDFVKVRVYSGVLKTASTPFPAIILDVGGEETAIGSHGQPPTASTGDVFEDALVTNDLSNPSFVRYSLPTETDYFPSVYFVDFETQDNDQVTNLKAFGDRVIVGLQRSLYRLNYLPNEDDSRFSRGKALSVISSDKGIVNAKAATFFTNHEGRLELAFFAATPGVFATDGFTVRNIASDVNWATELTGASFFQAGAVLLENDPQRYELKLYISGGSQTFLYRLHYHPVHIKEDGQLKVSGPHYVYHSDGGSNSSAVRAARVVNRSDGSFSTYTGYEGNTSTGAGIVYRDSGVTIPSVNTPSALTDTNIKTRKMYLAGYGKEWRCDEVYIHHQNDDPTASLAIRADISRTGLAESTGTLFGFTTTNIGLSKVEPSVLGDAVRLFIRHAAAAASIQDWTLDYLVIRGENFGREETP